MICENSKTLRQKRYEHLRKVVEEKGRLPFQRENQKYAKLMMFIYESLLEMASKSFLQNNDGILFKIHFTSSYNISKKQEYNGKLIIEYGISVSSSRFRAFEIQHSSIENVVMLLNKYASYYLLSFEKEKETYTRTTQDHKYIVRLP